MTNNQHPHNCYKKRERSRKREQTYVKHKETRQWMKKEKGKKDTIITHTFCTQLDLPATKLWIIAKRSNLKPTVCQRAHWSWWKNVHQREVLYLYDIVITVCAIYWIRVRAKLQHSSAVLGGRWHCIAITIANANATACCPSLVVL